MDFREILTAFMADAGLDDGSVIDDGPCRFEFDGMRVTFSTAGGGSQLLLSAPIGTPPSDGREALYRAILESAQGDESVVVDPADGCLRLRRADLLDGLDLSTFKSNLEAFLNRLEGWRGLLTDYAPVAADRSRAEAAERDERRRLDFGFARVIWA